MSEYRGVGGVAREVVKKNRGVGGVAREVTKRYRGVNGVARLVFGANPVGRAVIRLYQTTGDTGQYEIKENGYRHWSSDSGYTMKFILDLYDRSGNMINYTLLSDISGLDEFALSVSTYFQLFSNLYNSKDNVFGVNAGDHETMSMTTARGSFTVTQNTFTTKFIDVDWRGSGSREVTFNSLYINGEEIPLTVTQ